MFKKKKYLDKYLPFPIKASHREYSMIASTHDDPSIPTPSLLNLSLQAIQEAPNIDLQDICLRMKNPPYFPNIWPGEHYKLLAAFVKIIQPKVVIEIGTATGMSSLCMKKHLPRNGLVITFDITCWENYEDTLFRKRDFEDQKLIQHTDNLYYYENIEKHMDLLTQADLIFIDATHDGILEEKLLHHFKKIPFQKNPYLLFDDIRVWSMLKMWREIDYPKMDLTSFGHWSGTGIVEWNSKTMAVK